MPPANAAKPVTDAPETDKSLKTPATAKKAAAENVKQKGDSADTARPVEKAAPAPVMDEKNRPVGIERPTTPDDLKMISGVGPKIEATLNGLGIYTFEQIAKWKKAEREWVDTYLKFSGRIERDDWVKQAKALAKGGEAEYIKVFGKKPR